MNIKPGQQRREGNYTYGITPFPYFERRNALVGSAGTLIRSYHRYASKCDQSCGDRKKPNNRIWPFREDQRSDQDVQDTKCENGDLHCKQRGNQVPVDSIWKGFAPSPPKLYTLESFSREPR